MNMNIRRFIHVLLLTAFVSVTAVAADDVMVSLFKFQLKMANSGNVEALMKLGEMYEQGAGTKQDLNMALEMYQLAQVNGKKEAAASIKRVEKKQKYGSTTREKAANDKAARDKAARDKAARAKAARDKATRDKAARDKAARDKAARDKAAREQAAQERTIKERVAAEKATQKETTHTITAKKKAEERFTTDPCDTPAARFMSNCRKR